MVKRSPKILASEEKATTSTSVIYYHLVAFLHECKLLFVSGLILCVFFGICGLMTCVKSK